MSSTSAPRGKLDGGFDAFGLTWGAGSTSNKSSHVSSIFWQPFALSDFFNISKFQKWKKDEPSE